MLSTKQRKTWTINSLVFIYIKKTRVKRHSIELETEVNNHLELKKLCSRVKTILYT